MNEAIVVEDHHTLKSVRDMAKIEARKLLFNLGFFKADSVKKDVLLNDAIKLYKAMFAPLEKEGSLNVVLYYSIKTLQYMIQNMADIRDAQEEKRKYAFQGCIK